MLRKCCLFVQCGLQSGGGVAWDLMGGRGLDLHNYFQKLRTAKCCSGCFAHDPESLWENSRVHTKYPGHKDKDSTEIRGQKKLIQKNDWQDA